ncbi:hypothetical protein L1987_57462 [Smallanthus sonchifolius]|uniref:Uncharacterized protein n=1 Tax=Smallanthus sonchifolius TaxID=185202 RepID=A0ACB9DCL9_9ASTR|nr:hypothetical protein L1987_57462 [Smallanthus sonchifolius]
MEESSQIKFYIKPSCQSIFSTNSPTLIEKFFASVCETYQAMALSGKLIGYVEISKRGDVFHDLLRHKPHEMVAKVPEKVHDCELHEGERGAVGSIITWHFTHEGKKKISKQIIESVNEENHTIVFKVIGGELVDKLYKSFKHTFHVEPKGDGQVATWSLRGQIQVYPIRLL